jgi:hypothetical protein
MQLPDWLEVRLSYLEYLLWAGIGVTGGMIAAMMSGGQALTKQSMIVSVGAGLVVVFARMVKTPREEWDMQRREAEIMRRKKLAALEAKQEVVVEAVKEVSAQVESLQATPPPRTQAPD